MFFKLINEMQMSFFLSRRIKKKMGRNFEFVKFSNLPISENKATYKKKVPKKKYFILLKRRSSIAIWGEFFFSLIFKET